MKKKLKEIQEYLEIIVCIAQKTIQVLIGGSILISVLKFLPSFFLE